MHTYTNTCTHAHMLPHKHSHKHWHSEDALLICWLTEFNGEPNTLPLTNSAEQNRERDGERENTAISLQGGIQEKKVDKKESMILLLYLKKGSAW